MNAAEETSKKPQKKEKASPAAKKIRFQRVFTKEGIHPFDTVKWVSRDAVLIGADGREKFRQNGVEVPDFWNDTTITVVAEKYFRVVNGVKENSAKQMFHRVAFNIARWALEQGTVEGGVNDGGNWTGDVAVFYDELLYMLLHGMYAFNSPVWFNVGVVKQPQCSACFIQAVEDEMGSILDLAKKEVMLFKGGSGTGTNLSPLRSTYEKLSGGGQPSGPVSFMRMFDSGAGVTKSGGTTRRAAKMVVLNADHPDILEMRDGSPGFITCKSHAEQVAHDLYSTGKYTAEFNVPGNVYDLVGFQNANNSVRVTDEFMRAVERDDDWATKEILTGRVVAVYKARHLWKEIAKAAWMCGDPGLQFDTTTNAWHTSPNSGRINASNPCSEYLYLDETACNLGSLNLKKFLLSDGTFDADAFEHACDIAITAKETIVDASSYPSDAITRNSHTYRTLGLGYTNLGALLTFWGLPYDSNEGRTVAAAITAIMGGAAYRQSARLAEVKGPFIAYENNQEAMLNVITKHVSAAKRIPFTINKTWHPLIERAATVWIEALELGRQFGYRNGQVTNLAPTGTISFLMGADTTGVEPKLAHVVYKKLVGGGQVVLPSEETLPALKNLGYADDVIEGILAYLKDRETLFGAPGFDYEKHGPVFPEAVGSRSLPAEAHILMMSAVQPFLSGGISKTVNMPKDTTPEEIEKIYMLAWKEGLKCVAIYRDKCKLSQPISSENSSTGKRIKKFDWGERKKMPDDRIARTVKFSIGGTDLYVTVGLWPDGHLGEMFLRIAKQGSTLSGIVDWAATATSIALQYGAPLEALAEKFIEQTFEPNGYTSHPVIRRAKSIPDLIFQWLVLEYAPGARHLLRLRDMNVEVEEMPAGSLSEARAAAEKDSTVIKMSFDGPPCIRCGNMTKRSGSCYTCMGCGSTSGCG